MKLKIHNNFLVFRLIVLIISGFVMLSSLVPGMVSTAQGAELKQASDPADPIPTEKEEVPPSTEAITPEEEPTAAPQAPMAVTMLSTDFEASEVFSPGFCAQNGWTAFAASSNQGQISNTNPSSGNQHLRLARDTAVAQGTFVGCFSPNVGAQPVGPAWTEIDVAISGTGGADYDVIVQSPSQGYITARVSFDWLGNIWVVDDLGSGAQWVNTGEAWNVGPHTRLRIEITPAANTIVYYYGGTPFYSGSIFAGTTVEQIIFLHDNWNSGDVGNFDNLEAYAGTFPTSITLVNFQSRPTNWLPTWIVSASLAGLLLFIALILRRRYMKLTA